ncbi:MAG TPA: class I SAM-dependent methyltransferase [Xanthobacteraceae bacterium]|nr:class I SAM-dependent methyltransferase [Xanthobacteraceae bacterium]
MFASHARRLWHWQFAAVSTVCLLNGAAQAQVKLDVPYVPTPQAVVDRMLTLAKVTADDFVIDLGSGDGRILITAASKFGARGLGVDVDPRRIAEANANARKAGVEDRVTFRQQDLFQTSLGQATVLTMYLLQSVNLKLRPRILKELRPGARVVSHAFHMGNWAPDRHEVVDDNDVYLWIVPANVNGQWRLRIGEQVMELTFNQRYQKLTGWASINGRKRRLEDATLRGSEISFVLNMGNGQKRFTGRVTGDVIEPSVSAAESPPGGGRADDWRATRS